MTNLVAIRHVLSTNTEVEVAEEYTHQYLPSIIYPQHVADIRYWVAPKTSIFAADSLQSFMNGLFPGLTPVERKDVREIERHFYFGRLEFQDVVGKHTLRRTIEIEDEEYRQEARKEKDKDEETFPIIRRITVTVYPCRAVAIQFRNYSDISKRLLWPFMENDGSRPPRQRSFFSRLFQGADA